MYGDVNKTMLVVYESVLNFYIKMRIRIPTYLFDQIKNDLMSASRVSSSISYFLSVS